MSNRRLPRSGVGFNPFRPDSLMATLRSVDGILARAAFDALRRGPIMQTQTERPSHLWLMAAAASLAILLSAILSGRDDWAVRGAIGILSLALPLQLACGELARRATGRPLSRGGRCLPGAALLLLPTGLCALLASYSLIIGIVFIIACYGASFAVASGACWTPTSDRSTVRADEHIGDASQRLSP